MIPPLCKVCGRKHWARDALREHGLGGIPERVLAAGRGWGWREGQGVTDKTKAAPQAITAGVSPPLTPVPAVAAEGKKEARRVYMRDLMRRKRAKEKNALEAK